MDNLIMAFQHDRWLEDTERERLRWDCICCELSRRTHPTIGVENGYGDLLIEFGILGRFYGYCGSPLCSGPDGKSSTSSADGLFSLGVAIWWYAVVLLIMLVYFGLPAYQNYVNNAYLWLLVGVLYRLRNWLSCHRSSLCLQADVLESFLDGNLPRGPDKRGGDHPEFVSFHQVERVGLPPLPVRQAVGNGYWRPPAKKTRISRQ